VDHIDEFRDAVRKVRKVRPFYIDAWVLLPEHTHCIWTLPEEDSDYSGRWREIKKAFSKSLPMFEYRSKTRIKRNKRGVWQRRFWEHTIRNEQDYQRHWEHTIRNEQDYQRHMDYIHFNPVKHCLVQSVKDYRCSQMKRYF
ncbi:MAG: hypothetical protein ABFS35_23935, partial [Bacteroidota bacterium]